ncbi:MAG: hypothetical protein ACHREM_00455 [Polyangiales bacterium]
MRDPKNLTPAELVGVVRAVQDALWPNGDLDHEWSADTLEEIHRALMRAGLNVRQASVARGSKR